MVSLPYGTSSCFETLSMDVDASTNIGCVVEDVSVIIQVILENVNFPPARRRWWWWWVVVVGGTDHHV